MFKSEDLQLFYDESNFSISNKNAKEEEDMDLCLHAMATKDSSCSLREAKARIAVRSTKNRQWLGEEEISRVADGEVDGEVYDKAFSFQLESFLDSKASWSCVCYMMSQVEEIGDGDGDGVEILSHYVCEFLKVAGTLGKEMGCRVMVVVVELSFQSGGSQRS